MGTFCALLRSVNVGGRNRLPMADLRQLMEALGFADVATYVQSGNVVFSTRRSAATTAQAIAAGITDRFGFTVPVIVRSAGQLRTVLDTHPFAEQAAAVATSVHVTFLVTRPDPADVAALEAEVNSGADRFGDDRLVVVGDHVALYCPGGYGETKLNNTFLERRLHVEATTRNWRTVVTLADLAEATV